MPELGRLSFNADQQTVLKDVPAPKGFRDQDQTRLAVKFKELNAYSIHAACLSFGSMSKPHCIAEYSPTASKLN